MVIEAVYVKPVADRPPRGLLHNTVEIVAGKVCLPGIFRRPGEGCLVVEYGVQEFGNPHRETRTLSRLDPGHEKVKSFSDEHHVISLERKGEHVEQFRHEYALIEPESLLDGLPHG